MTRLFRVPQLVCASLMAAAFFAFPAPPASAAPGQALQMNTYVFGQVVQVAIVDYTTAETDGGATLFAAAAAGGPVLARVPLMPPYQYNVESGILPTYNFNGVPAGVYYLTLVSGVVATPAVPGSAWKQVIVSGGCPAAVPGIGSVLADPNPAPGTLGLFLASGDGCATTHELEAGTAPGAGNIGTFTGLLQAMVVPTPPPGVYYVRARGRNAFGAGPWSDVLPISVPTCNPALGQRPPDGPFLIKATVVGNNVTLTWSQSPGGPPQTFQELLLFYAQVGSQPVPTILLPGALSTVSAAVPSGNYLVGILGGNACGKSDFDSVAFTVP